MILLVDAGATKADWIALDQDGNRIFNSQSQGLSPEVLTREDIVARLEEKFDILQNRFSVTDLYFYGAGCGTDRMKNLLTEIFTDFFPNATISVKEDTYAAVFATTPRNEKAIVSILGTGSNCSYFDGETLHQKVQSLGYIAMDDCSGNHFGKQLIRGYYFGKMPKNLALQFEQEYDLDADSIKNNLYKRPNPNAYLATFAKFLIQHKDNDFCQKIIFEAMESFVENYIKQFENCHEVPNHFIGSIAFYLKDELQQVMTKHNLQLGNILRRPIDGLIDYHITK
ncbi:N-acetylglucosamine kinase [Flavobacterium sp. '19STA2R22 D10 B1']|uniref:N-acetylglucosamine kinase n=1 Tax=Flavobacterium aerium TaxID=3037261 RepID=UPI00278BB35B|nr:N-acetylglucosamine kinase [Flavobacterium sp. '19STA2R22 D10 B1']